MPILSKPSSLGRTFDRLWSASMVSNLADGFIGTAAPLLAVTLTRNPMLIALFGAMGSLPWLLFAVPIGGIADRVDRGVALAVVNAVRLSLYVVAVIALALGWMSLPLLFVITFLVGICEVFVDTTTQAVMPMILEPSQFERGNARLSIAESVVQTFVGGPLGGFLFAIAVVLPFALGAAGYVVATAFIVAMVASGNHQLMANRSAERQHFVEELKEGIRFLVGHTMVRGVVLFTTTVYILFNVAHATNTLFILDELGVPQAWFGALLSLGGVGYIGGSAVASRVSQRLGRGRAMAWCMAGSAVLVTCEGLAPNLWAYGVLVMGGSFLIAIWNILLMAAYQVLIPAELFGRVHGARRTLVWGLGPIGAVAGGWLATFGLRVPLVVGGLGVVLVTLWRLGSIVRLGDATAAA